MNAKAYLLKVCWLHRLGSRHSYSVYSMLSFSDMKRSWEYEAYFSAPAVILTHLSALSTSSWAVTGLRSAPQSVEILWEDYKMPIYNWTFSVTVTSFWIRSTLNFGTTITTLSEIYDRSFAYLSLHIGIIGLENWKRGNKLPPAAGGWRGGPAAAGLTEGVNWST